MNPKVIFLFRFSAVFFIKVQKLKEKIEAEMGKDYPFAQQKLIYAGE